MDKQQNDINATSSEALTKEVPEQLTYSFNFNGTAGEYFGIWFVNHTLTMLTIGIYSAWAKVRNTQYFYANTELAGGTFQFTANPWHILRSRIIAFSLFVVFLIVENMESREAFYVYIGFIVAYVLFSPVLTVFVMSFRLRYSSWRGINFRFKNDFAGAYRVYMLPTLASFLVMALFALPFYSNEVEEYLGMEPYIWGEDSIFNPPDEEEYENSDNAPEENDEISTIESEILAENEWTDEDWEDEEPTNLYFNPLLLIPGLISLILFFAALPYFDFISMRFLVRNTHFGKSQCTFVAELIAVYRMYLPWFFATIAFIAYWLQPFWIELEYEGRLLSLIILSMLYIPLTNAWFKSRRYSLLFSNLTIADGKFRMQANVPFVGLFFLLFINTLVVTITFGLMSPWAKVRLVSYLLDKTSMQANGSLNEFLKDQTKESEIIGEEIADVFDIDVDF